MLNCEHMRPLYDLDVSYYPPWISWHNLNRKKRVLQFQHWLAPPNNWFRFKYTTKLDSAWGKYTYRLFFQGGGLGENLAVIAELGRLSGCFGHSGAESNYNAKGCPLLVSGALQHLAGHDPGSISTEKAAYPRKDKNWAGTFFFKRQLREKWTR